jgi:hypothetical protein
MKRAVVIGRGAALAALVLTASCFSKDATRPAPSCQVRRVQVNLAEPHVPTGSTLTPRCVESSNGELSMTFAPMDQSTDPATWASCTFSRGHRADFLASQPDATLAVTFCVTHPTAGQLTLWHEILPVDVNKEESRFPAVLIAPDEVAVPGCYTRSFAVGTLCQKDCRAAAAAGASSQFTLAAEYRTTPISPGEPSATAELVSVELYGADCRCLDDQDCAATAACTTTTDSLAPRFDDPRCGASGACAGICSDVARADGGGAVGRSADGAQAPRTALFREAYRRLGPLIGQPGCEGTTTDDAPAECATCREPGAACQSPFVFDLDGADAQLFFQPTATARVASADPGWGALVLGAGSTAAFGLRWPFLQTYRCLALRGAMDAGPDVLGAPLGDAWLDGSITRQRFEHGDLSFVGTEVDLNLDAVDRDVTIDACAKNLPGLTPRIKPRGSNQTVVFGFTGGTDGLKANPVTGKAGDVSSLAGIAPAPSEGDLDPGAAEIDIPFSQVGQSATFLIQDPGQPRDLTGVVLFARVKIASGFNRDDGHPGGLYLAAYDTAFANCTSGYLNVKQTGAWEEHQFALADCVPQAGKATLDETHVSAYGLTFAISPDAMATPVPAVVYVDSIGYRVP